MVVGSCGIFCMKGDAGMALGNKARKYNGMTIQDKKDFNELYEYVKHNVMGYGDNFALDKQTVLRLRGLRYGKLYDNTKSNDVTNYPFSVVLYTFKACAPKIQKALNTKHFDSDQHKFNYIAKIVEDNLNDMYVRFKHAQKIGNIA